MFRRKIYLVWLVYADGAPPWVWGVFRSRSRAFAAVEALLHQRDKDDLGFAVQIDEYQRDRYHDTIAVIT